MKKIVSALFVFSLLLISCQGEDGAPGLNADEYAALSFEASPVDFQFFNDTGLQEAIVNLPFDILDSDVVLVYRLDEVVDIDGQPTDAWSPLPQNFFINDTDIIQYVFNHTFVDVKLLIDGNFNLSTLDEGFTKNQVFRIIILPADAINSIDTSNIEDVMQVGRIQAFEKK